MDLAVGPPSPASSRSRASSCGHGWVSAAFDLEMGYAWVDPLQFQDLGAMQPVDRVSVWLGASLSASRPFGRAPDFFRDAYGKGPVALNHQSSLTADVGGIVEIAKGWGVVTDVWHVLSAVCYPELTGASVGACWSFGARTPHN